MPRPTFLQEDTVKRADRLALSNKIDADIFAFSFPDQMERDISSLKLPEPPPMPEPLPVVVSPRPEIRQRQPEPAAMPQQSIAIPQEPPSRADTTPSATGVAGMTAAAPLRAQGGQPAAMPSGGVEPHLAMVARVAREEGVPFDALAALGDVEQSADDAVSPAGARGRWQVVPGQGFDLPGEDPTNPEVSARQGARALREKHRMTGSWEQAGRAYFGYGTDAGGMDTDTYGQRYDAARARYQGAQQGPQPTTPAPAEETPQAQAQYAPVWGTYTPETLTPNQLTEGRDQGLSTDEALAVCGPAAAVAFVRANGRNPTLREAKELAQNLGLWDVNAGMHGPASQVQLLDRLGIKSNLQEGADWATIAREVQSGRPVIVDTPQHYYTVTGYDPRTGEFEFGQSAGVLRRSGGKTRWRPDQLPDLGMGSPRATIYMGAR